MAELRPILEVLRRTVNEIDERLTAENQIGVTIAARTTRIIRNVLIMLGILALINLYLIQDLAQGMLSMTRNMDSMYGNFALVSRDMQTITQAVVGMNERVRSLPVMKEDMVLMSQDMASMNRDVQLMDQSLAGMDQDVAAITNGVTDMAWRFDQLTQTIQGMGYNVNQMSQPVRTLDPFGMLGR